MFSPSKTGEGDAFTVFTDGGVTNSLELLHDGTVKLRSNVLKNSVVGGKRIGQETTVAGHFDINQPVHLIWETDAVRKSTSVTVNGQTYTRDGLAIASMGLRNGLGYPAPLFVRLSLNDTGERGPLSLRSFRITGSDWDGPSWGGIDGLRGLARELTELPIQVPPNGRWQPEYSRNGFEWIPFGAVIENANGIDAMTCGRLVSPERMFLRLREAP